MIRADRARQRFRGSFLKQRRDRAPLGTDLGDAELGRPFASNHHEIDSLRQKVRQSSKALAAEALDAIAPHCAADSPPDDEAEARRTRRRRLGCHEQREMGRPYAPARALRPHELCVLAEPPLDTGHEARALASRGLSGHTFVQRPLLLVDGRHQVLATLAAAILKDFPAAVRRHAGAEAVGACPADVVGLVGALHGGAQKKAPPASSVKLTLLAGPSPRRTAQVQVFAFAGAPDAAGGLLPRNQ